MTEPFHKRFDIEVKREEAQRRLLERIRTGTMMVLNEIAEARGDINKILEISCFTLGERPRYVVHVAGNSGFMSEWDRIVGDNFSQCLHMTEAIHDAVWKTHKYESVKTLTNVIRTALEISEVDLEINWNETIFAKKGAKLLDDKLVNDPLHWLRERKYENVRRPFEKGLNHWMEVHKHHERCGDVITDMYEAVEALAKIITGRDRDLSANREKFGSEIELPQNYKQMLKEYVDFGCKYRHAAEIVEPREYPSEKDTEAFMYMTGLFIRRAIQPR
jgi:hypothetical protein